MSTDYDSWKQDEVPVTWQDVLKVFEENVQHVTELIIAFLTKLG
jgi:5'-methylthioadenosine phosphorylase